MTTPSPGPPRRTPPPTTAAITREHAQLLSDVEGIAHDTPETKRRGADSLHATTTLRVIIEAQVVAGITAGSSTVASCLRAVLEITGQPSDDESLLALARKIGNTELIDRGTQLHIAGWLSQTRQLLVERSK